jgi:hypothetical protein
MIYINSSRQIKKQHCQFILENYQRRKSVNYDD